MTRPSKQEIEAAREFAIRFAQAMPPMPSLLAANVHLANDLFLSEQRFAAEPESGQAKRKVRHRRRALQSAKPRKLTPLQVEAIQTVSDCKGNIAKAARRLGKNRKTVEESYKTGLAKLGKEAVKHGTRLIARDRRGQADIAAEDDRRG